MDARSRWIASADQALDPICPALPPLFRERSIRTTTQTHPPPKLINLLGADLRVIDLS